MRNLKKFLALVLAMVMAFSLMVTANAAVTQNATDDSDVYNDGDTVLDEFQVAVDVLTGMGIFHGNSGEFNAKTGITRAEAAAVLYRLVTGDVTDRQAQLYAPLATQRFTDVADGAWYAGYVGFAVDAGLVNGYNGRFMPANNVTGYEMLKMLLKAVGYGKNGEFTGAMWQINVGSTAQSASVPADAASNNRNILSNIEKTHYKNTLSQPSAREVVAELTFQVALNVPMVEYQYGWYNPYVGVPQATGGNNRLNPSLGAKVFGLAHNFSDNNGSYMGIVVGNQDTGETSTKINGDRNGYDYYRDTTSSNVDSYDMVTGLEMFGRKVDLYYSTWTVGGVHPVYAYYDKSTLVDVVNAIDDPYESVDPHTAINLTDTTTLNTLGEVASRSFKLDPSGAVMCDSFGRMGDDLNLGNTGSTGYGNGNRSNKMEMKTGGVLTSDTDVVSPIHKYLLISNSADKTLDVVIALNVEATQITESNVVRGVETVGMPVDNGVNGDVTNTVGATDSWIDQRFWSVGTDDGTAYVPFFIADNDPGDGNVVPGTTDKNTGMVGTVRTGVIAKDALTKTAHESASTLKDYVLAIHINGTNQNNDLSYARYVSTAEKNAITPAGATNSADETGYFLLNKATEVTGKVVYFDGDKVILEGRQEPLYKSEWYDTAVCLNTASVDDRTMPLYALPQSVAYNRSDKVWSESYNNETYTFYLDYEGKYLGAERGYSNSFIYGTYVDYRQDLNSSKFEYFLTGIDLNGEKVVGQLVEKYWSWEATQTITDIENQADWRKVRTITSTADVGVPYRDSQNNNKLDKNMPYKGFTLTGTVLDENPEADAVNLTDYATNMARLNVIRGIKGAGSGRDDFTGVSNGMGADIEITQKGISVGAIQTETGFNYYLTNNTKFILVSGYGTDTLDAKVVNGIKDLGEATIHLDPNDATYASWFLKKGSGDPKDVPFAAQTYFVLGNTVFSQTGQTAYEVERVILPAAAVTYPKTAATNSYYMGDPNYTLISANAGTPFYRYKVYDVEGNLSEIWLDAGPNDVYADTFLTVKDSGEKTSDGEKVYTPTFLASYGSWNTGSDEKSCWTKGSGLIDGINSPGVKGEPRETVMYQPINGDVATFTWLTVGDVLEASGSSAVLNVSGAKVTNVNATRTDGGSIWPGVTDLDSLNHAGSIASTTGTPVRVAAVCNGGTKVTHIFVCWDQSAATAP